MVLDNVLYVCVFYVSDNVFHVNYMCLKDTRLLLRQEERYRKKKKNG